MPVESNGRRRRIRRRRCRYQPPAAEVQGAPAEAAGNGTAVSARERLGGAEEEARASERGVGERTE